MIGSFERGNEPVVFIKGLYEIICKLENQMRKTELRVEGKQKLFYVRAIDALKIVL
jgi:hypothetical protein